MDYLLYEYFVIDYHAKKYESQKTWHWSNIPDDALHSAGWFHSYNEYRLRRQTHKKTLQEYGLDGLSYESQNDSYHGIQAKYYSQGKLCAHHLGSFYQVIFMRLQEKNISNTGYLYATCPLQIDVSDDIKNTKIINYEYLEFSKEITGACNDESMYALYNFQKDAVMQLQSCTNSEMLLSMPCSTGKTLILGTYFTRCNYELVIILSPTRVLAMQNKKRIEKFLHTYNSILISSDASGTRDVNAIIRKIAENKSRILLNSTYKSTDILESIFKNPIKNCVLAIDECHNIDSNVQSFINNYSGKIIYLSATPSSLLDICPTFEMKFSDAIKYNYITDYNIYIPIFENSRDINNIYSPRVEFLITGMLRKGSRRCIVFLNRQDDCVQFTNLFEQSLKKYHGRDCKTYIINSLVSQSQREKVLADFAEKKNPDTLRIIASVRVLDEGVDIPTCDSVYIAMPTQSVNDTSYRRAIQRLNRSTRKDANNPSKVANCFIYGDEFDEIANVLQILKYNDIDILSKVSVLCVDYDSAQCPAEFAATEEFKKFIIGLMNYEELWAFKLDLLKKFVSEFRVIPSKKDIYKNINIGSWCHAQRQQFKKNKISENRIMQLNTIDQWYWKSEKQVAEALDFDVWYAMLEKYIAKNHRIPKAKEQFEGQNLGKWCDHIRQKLKTNKLNLSLVAKFNKFDEWYWNKNISWNEYYNTLQKYIKKTSDLPKYETKFDNINIGIWCDSQKTSYEKNKLSIERLEKLEQISIWRWRQKRKT